MSVITGSILNKTLKPNC